MISFKHKWLLATGVVICAAVGIGAVQAAKSDYASADMGRIVTECKQNKDLLSELDAKQRQYVEALQNWYNRPLMSEAEFLTMVKVLTNPKATDAEKAANQKLLDTATERNKELNSLRSKPNPSDAEKQRLQELTRQEQSTRDLLQQYSQQYKSELDQRRSDRGKEIVTLVRATLADVAKKKGCAVVFDSSAAVYSENDITQATLDEVNKKK